MGGNPDWSVYPTLYAPPVQMLGSGACPAPAPCASNGTVQPFVVYSFEYPALSSPESFIYNPDFQCPYQPWTFTYNLGGIAAQGSPFDPDSNPTPPDRPQYAFVQDGGSMSATLTDVIIGQRYTAFFYYSTRHSSSTANNCQLLINGAIVWSSPADISVPSGWVSVTTNPFTLTVSSAALQMSCQDNDGNDNSVLFDNFIIA